MKRSLLCILLVPLLFFSCQEDVVEEIESLNSTGEQFIELISTYGDWRTDWDKINEMGTPLPNEAGIIYVIPQNGYYILPVLNDNEIISVVLYPIRVVDKKRLTTTSPVIVGKEEAKENGIVQNFLESKLFNEWREKGYSINIEKNDTLSVEHASLSRCIGRAWRAHLFCVEVHGYIYTQNAREYIESENKIFQYTDYFYYGLRDKGAVVEKDYYSHFCVQFPADRFTLEEARSILYLKIEEYRWNLVAIPYMRDLNFGIRETPWFEETGGGGGGTSQEKVCPYGKCSGNPCTCCTTCQGPCPCVVCHKDFCECIREVLLTVRSTTTGEMVTVRIGMTEERYLVPLYNVVFEATDDNGNAIVENYEAIRFGVKFENDVAVVKGLQDEMTYTVSEFIPAYCGESPAGDAWRFYGGHLLHAGPKSLEGGCNMYGCVGICKGKIGELYQKLLLYSNAKTEVALASSGKFKIHVEAAAKPPLVPKN